MSREQGNTYRKFRDAEDAMGNLGWASKLSRKALRHAPEAPPDTERVFEMSDDERVLWRILKVPRKYVDLENVGVLPAEKIRAILRGLVSADVVDVVEGEEGKPILPLEVNRIRRALAGQEVKVEVKRKTIEERVFRPDIGLDKPPPEPVVPAPVDIPGVTPPPKPAAAPAPKRLSLDDMKLKERIEKAYTERMKGNHYVVLGVPPDAPPPDVKKAYVALARDWHPDVIAGSGLVDDEAFKTKLDKLFKRLQEAYDVLSDAGARNAYDRSGAAATEPSSGKKIRRTAEANVAYIKGETFLKKKEWKQAETHYRMAIDLDEEEPKYRTALAWAIFQNETREKAQRTTEAKKLLREIVNSKKYADAAYRLGLIARVDGEEVEAAKRFEEAWRLDPKHPEAQREHRLTQMRNDKAKQADDKKSGLFGKLLK